MTTLFIIQKVLFMHFNVARGGADMTLYVCPLEPGSYSLVEKLPGSNFIELCVH